MRKDNEDLLEQAELTRPLVDLDVDVRRLPTDAQAEPLQRRRYFRPAKQSVTIRLDTDVVAWFKAGAADGGYQTAINRALREYMNERS
jgi:Uncharacterized protein conserved in bacteria